jgi:sortase A
VRRRLPSIGLSGAQIVRQTERALIIAGLSFLTIYAGARMHQLIFSRLSIENFKAQRSDDFARAGVKTPDFRLWSQARIREYTKTLSASPSKAIAILRIPKIQLEVPVLDGTDEITLNRAVGLIAGTARPGDEGNVGIAGHRDGFFRGLKDLHEGDEIELETVSTKETYAIDHISIVSPEEVSVLLPRAKRSLTLVTCYPFYFVGSAPQRYIVQALLVPAVHKSDVKLTLTGNSRNDE